MCGLEYGCNDFYYLQVVSVQNEIFKKNYGQVICGIIKVNTVQYTDYQ